MSPRHRRALHVGTARPARRIARSPMYPRCKNYFLNELVANGLPACPVSRRGYASCCRRPNPGRFNRRTTWSLFPFCRTTRSMNLNVRDTLRQAGMPGAGVLTAWRRRRAVAKQDAFVEAWKTAWSDGCRRRWEGGPRDEPSYSQDDQRAAWVAGWEWADAHPDRRRQSGPLVTGYRRSRDRRAQFARGARRGIAAFALVAVARWWWRRRGLARPGPVPSLERPDDSGHE